MDNNLQIFNLIANFVRELNPIFGEKQKSLKLYCHLIERTTLVNEKPIKKHINAFNNFCTENQDAIIEKNPSKIKNKIVYSTKVFLDMEEIFRLSDKQTSNIIWEHLLAISAVLDPTSKAKQILQEKKQKQRQNQQGKEAEFLGDIITKIGDTVDPNMGDNPMAAVTTILSSGILNDLISGMSSGLNDGTLSLPGLLGNVNNLVKGLQGEDDRNQNILNEMTETLGNVTSKIEELNTNEKE